MKKDVKNLPEFKTLIERYKTITLKEIEKVFEKYGDSDMAKQELTGFGFSSTCSLCAPIEDKYATNCGGCIYGGFNKCVNDTYDVIANATYPAELLAAYRARAAYMETLLK